MAQKQTPTRHGFLTTREHGTCSRALRNGCGRFTFPIPGALHLVGRPVLRTKAEVRKWLSALEVEIRRHAGVKASAASWRIAKAKKVLDTELPEARTLVREAALLVGELSRHRAKSIAGGHRHPVKAQAIRQWIKNENNENSSCTLGGLLGRLRARQTRTSAKPPEQAERHSRLLVTKPDGRTKPTDPADIVMDGWEIGLCEKREWPRYMIYQQEYGVPKGKVIEVSERTLKRYLAQAKKSG